MKFVPIQHAFCIPMHGASLLKDLMPTHGHTLSSFIAEIMIADHSVEHHLYTPIHNISFNLTRLLDTIEPSLPFFHENLEPCLQCRFVLAGPYVVWQCVDPWV